MLQVKNNSVYFNEPYPSNFGKLYKGVIVVVDNDGEDQTYCHFAIRTKKAKQTIFKTREEKLHKLIFDDVNKTITCKFDNLPKNKCPKTLTFESDVYDELKTNIPAFMLCCGMHFTEHTKVTVMELVLD